MTVVLDDHLLRDWLARRDSELMRAIGNDGLATTNLWYARLCRTAASAGEGALLGGWSVAERRTLVAGLTALPEDVEVRPLRQLAWRMGGLIADHRGLSLLGAEAVAATSEIGGRLLVSARDDGPGIRRCCEALSLSYETLAR